MAAEPRQRLEITVNASRAQLEALQLELRRLAKRHDVVIDRVTIERVEDR